jgi:hypothetical protein
MAFDDWEKDSEGKVKVYPLPAYEACVPHGALCGLRVRYFESPNDLIGGRAHHFPWFSRRDGSAVSRRADQVC